MVPILSNDENLNLYTKYGWAETTGWGYSRRTPIGLPIGTPLMLQTGTLPLINHDFCNAVIWENDPFITPNMVCAGSEGEFNDGISSCMGDSGGPLTVTVDGTKLLLGAVSFGQARCSPDWAGVYTNLATARMQDFVNDIINA